ncbi:MAG: winged helix-turn-helix domain-containing protein [Pseudomonadota bacterium]
MTQPDSISEGDWTLDLTTGAFSRRGTTKRLQPGVMRLLVHLVANAGRTVGKDELVEAVWDGRAVSDAALYSRVSALRRALGEQRGEASCIAWEYGRGVRFQSEAAEEVAGELASELAMDVGGEAVAESAARLEAQADEAAARPLGPTVSQPVGKGFVATAPASAFRSLFGIYFSYYRTPSWPEAIKCGVSVLTEEADRVAVRTAEWGVDKVLGVRQRARYRGFVEMVDGRLHVMEQNMREPRAICLLTLDTPHPFRPDIMNGLMMGSSWRMGGAPYATRVVWRRVPREMTIRDALLASGPYAEDDDRIEPAIRAAIGRDCLTFNPTGTTL